jgi:hypothetical protein
LLCKKIATKEKINNKGKSHIEKYEMSIFFSRLYIIQMGHFKSWLGENSTLGTENVESRIDQLYDKAKYAIKLVQLYSKSTGQKLLNNISTIAPLYSGVYGLYNSSENKKIIGPAASNKIRFKFGHSAAQQQNLQRIPNSVIKQYIPDIDERQLAPSDVIHVNVQKIVREFGDTKEAVLEIASTIIHETTHEIEFQTKGKTDEVGPKKAEETFKKWVSTNWNLVISRIPQINF